MSSDDGFAFILPLIFICFGVVFLIVARWSPNSALRWGLGYLSAAAGFATPGLLTDLPPQFQASLADLFFISAAYLNSEALLLHFGPTRIRYPRLGFAAVAYAATIYAVQYRGSLSLELILSDIAFVVLMASPLFFVWRSAARPYEKLLLVMVGLVVFNTIFRNIVFAAIADPGSFDRFLQSSYAYAMQATEAILGMLLALSALASVVLRAMDGYRDAAERDPLTRLLNRRGFEAKAQALRRSHAATIIMCDIDHFKTINDRYGHAMGDRVLVAVAEQLDALTTKTGFASRFGGEEFVIAIPEGGVVDAEHLANAMRLAIAELEWHAYGIADRITASFGIGRTEPTDPSIHDAVARADAALYAAKAAGRNRVTMQQNTMTRTAAFRMISAA
ncbi:MULTISPECIES: GGDEF domain-containing protein [Rhizobium]|nr:MULTISPECIES: GGDEF domain-containing protein [Rhizobium]